MEKVLHDDVMTEIEDELGLGGGFAVTDGSSIFAVCDQKKHAQLVCDEMRRENPSEADRIHVAEIFDESW